MTNARDAISLVRPALRFCFLDHLMLIPERYGVRLSHSRDNDPLLPDYTQGSMPVLIRRAATHLWPHAFMRESLSAPKCSYSWYLKRAHYRD